MRFGVWVVVSSALKARLGDWWRTKLDGKVVVVVGGCVRMQVYICIYMRARYDMHARGGSLRLDPPADPPCCLSMVSFLVVLVVWFFGRVVVGVLIRVSLRAIFLFFAFFWVPRKC